MDSSMNYYEDYNEEIRPPDEVKREQLISNNNIFHDKELEEAIYLSIQEAIEQEKKIQEYENKIIEEYSKEREKRRVKFEKLLFNLNKVAKFDKTLRETYEIIEPIIDAYCNQFIENYLVDDETFQSIFNNLNSIRTDKKIIDILKTIIISN
jgi:hypothetical protein